MVQDALAIRVTNRRVLFSIPHLRVTLSTSAHARAPYLSVMAAALAIRRFLNVDSVDSLRYFSAGVVSS